MGSMLTARFMNREPPGRRSYGPILVPVFITLAWLLTFTEVRQSQWVRPFLRSLPANLDRPAAHPFHFNHGVPRPHSGTAPSLPSALAAQSASGMYGGTDPLSSDSALPLAGRRILITAPRAYATALAARLVAAGARPLWVPGVVTRRLSSGSPLAPALDSALTKLIAGGTFSHVAFTSRAGVEAVLERLGSLKSSGSPNQFRSRDAVRMIGGSVLAAANASVWALGADAKALRDAGVSDVRSPPVASTDGLVAALRTDGLGASATVLCPVPEVVSPLTEPPVVPRFVAGLESTGASVIRVAAYETAPGTPAGKAEPECQWLASGTVDAVIFTSTAEAQGLALAVGGVARLVTALQRGRVLLAAHGPTTAAGVEAVLSLPRGAISVVPKDFSSFEGVVGALEVGGSQLPSEPEMTVSCHMGARDFLLWNF